MRATKAYKYVSWKAAVPETPVYSLVVHTNKYAGNFDGALCGYATGQADESSDAGWLLADEYKGPDNSSLIGSRYNEHGTLILCGILPTPAVYGIDTHASVVIHLARKPSTTELKHIVNRIYAFAQGARKGAFKTLVAPIPRQLRILAVELWETTPYKKVAALPQPITTKGK